MNTPELFNTPKKRIGIKWKMFAILIIFIVCILVGIWVVQIRMVNFFFQTTKFYELEESATAISEKLDNIGTAKDMALYYSDNYGFDIWILEITDTGARWIVEADSQQGTDAAFLPRKMEMLYNQAKKNGGIYVATLPSQDFTKDYELEVINDNLGNSKGFPKISRYNNTMGILYSRIDTVGTTEYLTVQYANLSSFKTTVSMLQSQFIIIGVMTGTIALIIAILLSKLITRPIVKMNESAKKLAEGNYNVDFNGKGYREIDELADTLNYASQELAKTDKLQKELISNVSHDLRTPLTMIKGYSEMMRDIPNENTPENAQIIIDETTRLSELVNDMLDLSKIQSGTRKPSREEFSITETLNSTLKRYEKLTMQDGYRIDVYSDKDVNVIADRGMILQVIYNLINNAINYTGDDKYVSVKQTVENSRVRISITDTGDGISPDDTVNIWERYYRVDKVHKRATIGTGLGLSIVKGILEAHEATYGVESKIGSGSTFWFELDIAPLPEIFDVDYDNTDGQENEETTRNKNN